MNRHLTAPHARRRSLHPVVAARSGLAVVLATAALLSGCGAPLLLGGAMVGTALTVADRRTAGTQVEDEAIELKALVRLRDTLGEKVHANITSYNRTALITGEALSEADRATAERVVSQIEHVHHVVNELGVMGASSLTSRTNDSVITGRVKTAMIDSKDLQAHAVKVVSERGVVYLMGRVTEREANRATDLARGVSGVAKVVRVFDVISEAELAALQPPAKK